MKTLLVLVLSAFCLSASEPCHTAVIGSVTLTRCEFSGKTDLFISSSDDQTLAMRINFFTETGGTIRVLPIETPNAVVHASFDRSGSLAGKLLHITVGELKLSGNAAFSADNGTLP